MEYAEIEVWVMVDENGDYGVGRDTDSMASDYVDNIGNDDTCSKRHIKLTIKVPKPKPLEVTFTLPDEAGEAFITIG